MNGQAGRASALAVAVGLALAAPAQADVVISQVYGGGGNSGATLRNDFVELHNNGDTAVSLDGWSVQYASASGTSWQRTTLEGSIAAGGYYLVQQARGSGGTQDLPTPDAIGTIAMAGSSGKVALAPQLEALSGACPTGVADLVGFGGANCFEGSAATPTLSNTTAALRLDGGCEDSGDNRADFATGAPTPRNSASAPKVCAGGVRTLNVADASIEEGADGTRELVFEVELTQPAPAGGVRFDWTTRDLSATSADGDYVAASGTVTIPSGGTAARITVLVAGDAREEQDERFELVISNIVAATAGDTVATGTIVNDDFEITPISAIQGDAAASPLKDLTVATRGVVTGVKSNGFFVQSLAADADASDATSEGLFVFTRTAPPAGVVAGAVVTVRGTVTEYVPSQDPGQAPLTQLAGDVRVFAQGATAPLPMPVELTAAFPSATGAVDQLERIEGMRVRVARLTVTAPTDGTTFERDASGRSNGVFHGVVAGVPRPFREPGIQAPDAPPTGSVPPIPRWDFNPELIAIDSDALGAPTLDVAAGTELAELTGVLDYGFRRYTLLPDAAPAVGPQPMPHGVQAPGIDGFTVAAYNLERFFDTVNDPGSDVTLTAAALERRLAKASLGIRESLEMPDILGVVEAEHLAVLQQLADRINADAVAAGQSDPRYTAHLLEGNDPGGIDVGFLVKSANVADGTPRIAVQSVEQIGKDTTWIEPDGDVGLLNDRPPLALEATVHYADGRMFPLSVVIVHQRSLNGAEDPGASGDRVRSKRQRQAEFLAAYLHGRQVRDPDARLVVLGDFNAFEFNDGLVDAMNVITGTPTPDEQTAALADGVDLVNPDLVNLGGLEPAHERYSFVFGGNAQTLDHVLVNEALVVATREITLDHARINADFPEINRNDATSPSRLSDHDPVVATFYPRRRADLVLTAVSAGDARIGQTFAFDVVLRNDGPEQADRPGVGFEFDAQIDGLQVSAPTGWNCDTPQADGGRTTLTCFAESLANGADAAFRLHATATAPLVGRTLALAAAAESESIDPQPGNNGARASLGITALADLRVALAGPRKHLRAGTRGGYRVAVGNSGPDAGIAPVLTLTGDVPARNLHFINAAGWSCPIVDEAAGFRATCTRAQLDAGTASSIDFSVVAPPRNRNGRDEIVVRAQVTSAGTDPDASNDTAAHVVRVIGSPK